MNKAVNEFQARIPGGVNIVGVFYFEDSFKSKLCNFVTNIFIPSLQRAAIELVDDFLVCKIKSGSDLVAEIISVEANGDAQLQDFSIIPNFEDGVVKEWHKERVLIRLKVAVPCQIMLCQTPIAQHQECKRVLMKLQNGPVAFITGNRHIICSERDGTVGEIFNELSPKDKQNPIIELGFFRKMTGSSDNSSGELFCPILMFNSGTEEVLNLNLDLDALVYADKSWEMEDFTSICRTSLATQAKAFIEKLVDIDGKFRLCTQEAFHYFPEECSFMITMLYPVSDINGKEIEEEDLVDMRRKSHEMFCLPMKKPFFMRSQNRFNQSSGDYLINPHENLKSGIESGMCVVVDGNYAYHHYMQDHIDDNGWGCAYRSLQSICSWFQLQGYTKKKVPSHKEIQEALVAVGDKPKKFVASRQWIGSFEVSICLDKILDVSSKILHVPSGAEMANKGRELLDHFKKQGTPVMIGGGVLAHTILGVHFDELSGDLKFLILDPHYTGSENLKTVQEKGWCGWKSASFWDQTAHYNMCMPQRPEKI